MIASPTDLLYFVEIASTLNLTKAAEKLDISQPSLSMAIQRLEKAVQAPLILRHKRGVTLTRAGKSLLARTKGLLEHWGNVKEGIASAFHNPEGQISVGCHLSVGLHSLPKFLPGFLHQYPKISVKMLHGFSYNLIDKISNYEIDIGLLVNPIKQSDLVIKTLYHDYDALWYVPSKLDVSTNKKLTLFCDLDRSQTQILLKQCKKHKLTFSRVVTSSSLEMLAALTASGSGIGILPARVVASTHPPQLQQLKSGPTTEDEVCLVYHYENKNVGAIKVFIHEISEFFKNKKI